MGLGGHVERARVRAPNRMVNVAYHITTISSTFLLWFTAALQGHRNDGEEREEVEKGGVAYTTVCYLKPLSFTASGPLGTVVREEKLCPLMLLYHKAAAHNGQKSKVTVSPAL